MAPELFQAFSSPDSIFFSILSGPFGFVPLFVLFFSFLFGVSVVPRCVGVCLVDWFLVSSILPSFLDFGAVSNTVIFSYHVYFVLLLQDDNNDHSSSGSIRRSKRKDRIKRKWCWKTHQYLPVDGHDDVRKNSLTIVYQICDASDHVLESLVDFASYNTRAKRCVRTFICPKQTVFPKLC